MGNSARKFDQVDDYVRERLVLFLSKKTGRRGPLRKRYDAAYFQKLGVYTLSGTVNKIIASLRTIQPEKAQIAVTGADDRYRDLRIENTLTDRNGNEVSLKKGAHIEVTVTAKPKK